MNDFRELFLETLDAALTAQLRAIRRLRFAVGVPKKTKPTGTSHTELALQVLHDSPNPMHTNDIVAALYQKHQVCIDRDSLTSILSKKVLKQDRVTRVGKNVFMYREKCHDSPI